MNALSATIETDNDLKQLQELSRQIEAELFTACNGLVSTEYKSAIRARFVSLKNKNNDLRDKILSGQVSPARFARMTSEEMATKERNVANQELKMQALQNSIIKPTLPETILEIKKKDSREREKWGMSSSAAAIDDFNYSSIDRDDDSEK
ncbi:transcription factor S-II, central domain-containing protein [Lipomyces japonicus]|uniref:transcription factor S-II, central domain-containing protein n=1 Tax=Lipomyces japonicus TaxID=56871 RepID=UPI0034CF70C2